ncbi:BlaI/MecI/CopY family transcriptional regulator [Kordiimonas sp.]|uniref:BlaI/MecI/CopY family transcriptional regulator n=1 Tax=Kordiimonas sp. TaxID=1970157 RepID=UPI003A8D0EB5
MSEDKKQISIAESKVMEALWRAHPLSAEDVTTDVAAEHNWSVGTVKSLLNRLLSKGAISAEKDGRRYLYSPVLSHDDYMTREGQGVLDRLFDGRVSALLTHFSRHEKLSGDDIAELKKLIKELDDDE